MPMFNKNDDEDILLAFEARVSGIRERITRLDELEGKVEELEGDNEYLRTELHRVEQERDDLHNELDAHKLNNENELPDALWEILEIAYRADPNKVEYLLHQIPGWRTITSIVCARGWVNQCRTPEISKSKSRPKLASRRTP